MHRGLGRYAVVISWVGYDYEEGFPVISTEADGSALPVANFNMKTSAMAQTRTLSGTRLKQNGWHGRLLLRRGERRC